MSTRRRQRGVAARVTALGSSRVDVRGSRPLTRTGAAKRRRAHRRAGQLQVTSGSGPDMVSDVRGVQASVAAGEISRAEASALLVARYPHLRWSGGQWGDANQARLDGALNELALSQDPHALVRSLDRPTGLKRNRGRDSAAGGDQPFHVEQLPAQYDQRAVQRALERLAEEAAQNVRMARTRPLELPAHSLSGEVLVPGSVPVEALEPEGLEREVASWPSADEAIEVRSSLSRTMDRFVTNATTGTSGPGRIWVADEVKPRSSSRVTSGPSRYRVLVPGQRFGVMSCRLPPTANLGANAVPGIWIQYGIVLARIPHFLGRVPSRVLKAEVVGDSPVGYGSTFRTGGSGSSWASGGTTRDHYWNRTQREHVTELFPYGVSFGSDAVLAPSAAQVADFSGFVFQLITGRDGGEVFRQLCSRATLGARLTRPGAPPGVALPDEFPIQPPAPAGAVTLGTTPSILYTHQVESFDLSTASRVVQGVPFAYEDCAALVPTESHFSLVLQVAGEVVESLSPVPGSWATPEEWHRNGVQIADQTAGQLRRWEVDLIIS